ncbi:sugar transferase, partial [Paracoccus liaowanqingii]
MLLPNLTSNLHSSEPTTQDCVWSNVHYSFYRKFGKRIFDLLLVFLTFPIFLILIPLLWAVVRLDGGPAFFGHLRVGRDGQYFYCWKFRTMVVNAEEKLEDYLKANPELVQEWQNNFKLQADPRITNIGNFLRKTSLDEIPQIWNILRGEMSFVGPRPIIKPELKYYGDAAGMCFAVRPGLTGLWQVSGRNEVTYSERVRLDIHYVSSISFMNDLLVILKTGVAVIRRTG